MLVGACGAQEVDSLGEVYFHWDDRKVLCAIGIDDVSGNSTDSLVAGLDRALDDGSVLLMFGHRPGKTFGLDRVEAIVTHAEEIGLPALTFRDLVEGPPRAGYSISYDDADVAAWASSQDILAAHGARVTLFVTRFHAFGADERALLRTLADAGHDVEAHAVEHQRAPDYVEEHGLRAYMDDEALPSIERLRDEGYDPVAYAYPFGSRTPELDSALLEHVTLLRSVSFSTGVPLVSDPCPE